MNSRERVIAAISHQPHDKVPVDIGANFATGLTVAAYRKLAAALESDCQNAGAILLVASVVVNNPAAAGGAREWERAGHFAHARGPT